MMDAADKMDLVLPTEGKAEAIKALGVLAAAFRQGGESARATVDIQTHALGQVHAANAELVKQIVSLVGVVSTAATQTVEIAKVSAARDVELAKIQNNKEFEARLASFAEGPIGMGLLARLGLVPNLSVPTEMKEAVGRVIVRFFAREEVCAQIQAENPEDYACFLRYVESFC